MKRFIMRPLRLRRVVGLDGRENDTLFLPAGEKPNESEHQTLVFFGGDVQDYPEIMAVHRDNAKYINCNLEDTIRMLAQNFPQKHILLVRPSRVELKMLSCYDNFVDSNNSGVPAHSPNHGALMHLKRLLQSVNIRLESMSTAELLQGLSSGPDDGAGASQAEGSVPCDLHRSRLSLVGFSKGCVVLNQMVHELHHARTTSPPDDEILRFVSRIESMYWLDGGHAGGGNTWLTQRTLLRTLADTGVSIFVHVSPYQVRDEYRPWIGQEEKTFTTILTKYGARISRYFHDSSEPNSLNAHFSVLTNFKRVQDEGGTH